MKTRARFCSIVTLSVVLLSLFTLSCGKKGGTGGGTTIVYQSTLNLTIGNQFTGFSPRYDSVAVGAILRWTNNDATPHTVTSDAGTELQSPNIGAGGTYVDTLNTPGIFPYHCAIHTGMRGQIKVQ